MAFGSAISCSERVGGNGCFDLSAVYSLDERYYHVFTTALGHVIQLMGIVPTPRAMIREHHRSTYQICLRC